MFPANIALLRGCHGAMGGTRHKPHTLRLAVALQFGLLGVPRSGEDEAAHATGNLARNGVKWGKLSPNPQAVEGMGNGAKFWKNGMKMFFGAKKRGMLKLGKVS